MIGAFFDFDNTLLSADSSKLAIAEERRQGLLGASFLLELGWTYVRFRVGLADTDEMVRPLLRRYAGRSEAELVAWNQRFFEQQLEGRLAPSMVAAVREHQSRGHRVVLLSAAVEQRLAPVAAHLGVTRLGCTRLERHDGVLTGRSLGPICSGPEKLRVARALAQALGIDMRRSWAYGDHGSDLPLLRAVGHPVAVSPDAALAAHAKGQGWPICTHSQEASWLPPASPES